MFKVISDVEEHKKSETFDDVYDAVDTAQKWRDECIADGWVKLETIPQGVIMGRLIEGELVEGKIYTVNED